MNYINPLLEGFRGFNIGAFSRLEYLNPPFILLILLFFMTTLFQNQDYVAFLEVTHSYRSSYLSLETTMGTSSEK